MSKTGLDCKLYVQTTGTRAAWPGSGAAPNLSEVTQAKDVTLNLIRGEAEVTKRGSGWKLVLPALKNASVEFEIDYDPTNSIWQQIRNPYNNGTMTAFAILDGTSSTAGTQGLWADFEITGFTRNEPLEGQVTNQVTLKPSARSSVDPAWVTVA